MANFNNFFYKAVRLIGNYVSLSNDISFKEDPSEYKNRFNFDTVKKLETVDGCNEVIDDLKKEMEYYSSKDGKKDKERVELAKELVRTILLIHGNNAKVNESMENPKYKAYAYFGSNFSGLNSDLESDDWMEIEDFCHDMLMQGNYCEIQNNESGKSVRITPDEYIDTFDGEFLYKASDLEESIKEDVNGKEIKRYSDVYSDEVKQRGWWYFTTHGVQPGSIPKDLNVLEVRDGKNNKGTMGTFVRLDGILNTSELKEFDMKEMSPLDESNGDFSYEYRLLGRLKADCDYVLNTCVGENGMSLASSQKHLWADSVGNQIAKMRELHNLLPDADKIVTDSQIDDYEKDFKDILRKEGEKEDSSNSFECLNVSDLKEANLTKAQRYNRDMNKIFSYKRATDDAMKKYLIQNGISEDEAEKLKQDNKLDKKLADLGLHDDFFDMWSKKKYDYDKSGEFYLMPENLVESDSNPKYTVYKQFGDYYVTEYDNYHGRISNARKNRKLNGFESAEEVVDYLLRNNWVNSRDELEVLTESKSKKTKKTESVLKNKRKTLKEAKQWSTKYPQYEYEFDDGIKITAADETEAREKYDDIIENRYTGVRSKDDIDNLAQQLYDSGNAWAFNYFSDEELAILWALCSLDGFGRAYDDEVYEAIYTQPEPQKIFKKAQRYYDKFNSGAELKLHEDKEDDDFETLKATVKNMTNDFKDAEGDLSDFYMTWNFGYNNDGFVTGGIDIRMSDRNDLDKAEEAKKKVEAIFAKNGFELDKTFPKNPGKTLFGGIHYQIISKDKILSESLREGAEGRKEPGFEFVILDMTDEKNPTVVAKRTTKVEAEWAALKMSGRAYGHKGMKKFDGKELEVQKAPIGEYKIGDTIDLDDYPYYNESLKEGYGEYITLELADKTDRKIIKDLYDKNELSIIQRGNYWYTEDCPVRYFGIVKEEMKKYFPRLSYLYDAQPHKSQLEKFIMRKLSNESLNESSSLNGLNAFYVGEPDIWADEEHTRSYYDAPKDWEFQLQDIYDILSDLDNQYAIKSKSRWGCTICTMNGNKPNYNDAVYSFDFWEDKLSHDEQVKEFLDLVDGRYSNELKEDTIKTKDGKWTNKGDEGTHGKFKTKKEADAQRKAMFARGYIKRNESLDESASMDSAQKLEDDGWVVLSHGVRGADDNYYWLARRMNKERGKADWKAINDKTGEVIDITYYQALGREPIGVSSEVSKLSKKLGKMLLPKNESVKKAGKYKNNLKEANLGQYRYRYEVYYTSPNNNLILFGAYNDLDSAVSCAIECVDNTLNNPFEEMGNRFNIIKSVCVYDSDSQKKIPDSRLMSYKSKVLADMRTDK